MRFVGVIGFALACPAIFFGQTEREELGETERPETEKVVPLPLVNPVVVEPGKLQPGMLTSKEKASLVFRNLTSSRTLVNRLIGTTYNQLRDHPEEWGGDVEGFGKRLAVRYGRTAVRNSVMLGLDIAFKTDGRYDRCDCAGFGARTRHAWKRVLYSRKDYGGEMISPAKIAGAYATPLIMDNFYPASLNTWEHKVTSGSTFLAWRGATNMLREFWPDIRRKFFKRKDD